MKSSALASLYATSVLEGERTMKQVPASIRERVQDIVNDSLKKQNEEK